MLKKRNNWLIILAAYCICQYANADVSNPKSPEDKPTYSCDLVQYAGICREYQLFSHWQSKKLPELSEGCLSMPNANFVNAKCPATKPGLSCQQIVRDHHHPDIVYSNYYYTTKNKNWTKSEVKRVCTDLEGKQK